MRLWARYLTKNLHYWRVLASDNIKVGYWKGIITKPFIHTWSIYVPQVKILLFDIAFNSLFSQKLLNSLSFSKLSFLLSLLPFFSIFYSLSPHSLWIGIRTQMFYFYVPTAFNFSFLAIIQRNKNWKCNKVCSRVAVSPIWIPSEVKKNQNQKIIL